jgi:hypothetical protein
VAVTGAGGGIAAGGAGVVAATAARTGSAATGGAATGAAAGFLAGAARNDLTFSISASSRLASADPFPVIPALVQISTRSLLSSLSSLAN